MSVYIREVIEGQIVEYLMKEAIKEVLEIDYNAEKMSNGYLLKGWHGPISYEIKNKVLEYYVDSWGKTQEWEKIKANIHNLYVAKVYETALLKAGWKNISKTKSGDKIRIYAR